MKECRSLRRVIHTKWQGITEKLGRVLSLLVVLSAFTWSSPVSASEADLAIPDLNIHGKFTIAGKEITAGNLLFYGSFVILGTLGISLYLRAQIKALPAHKSMLAVAEVIFQTCRTYLIQQGKFLAMLFVIIGSAMTYYFMGLLHKDVATVGQVLLFSIVGIGGSYWVAWYGIRVNTYANCRTAFASLKGEPWDVVNIPLRAGMSIGLFLISLELVMMVVILLFVPRDRVGLCFLGFAIGESLGASALRIAGGIFTKIADIGSDLMKIVFNVKEDDPRNPGVIADCTGDNAGDSVGPTADGFETYGVTGVALISFILLAVPHAEVQGQLIVWLFVMRVMMIVASILSYAINEGIQSGKYASATTMNFEHPLTFLVWLTSIISVVITYIASYLLIPDLGGDGSLWWKLSTIITCGTLAGAIIPEVIKVFTSTNSAHVRECVEASKEGGASLNVLAGLTAGNFSAYWMGLVIVGLMGIAYFVSGAGLGATLADGKPLMLAPAVFAFGLVAFGFLGMGPVTIAVDSYGPVTDNAQSVYELSLIETIPNIKQEIKKQFDFDVDFERAKAFLEENDGAGNTFKATAKPVLIGTAVVGATTMIFSIVMALTHGLTANMSLLSILHPPFLFGLILGGSVIYWFTGASTQAVATGAYRAVEFIKANIKLEGVEKASITDSKKVVEICTLYAQRGMFNIFLVIFFSTLAFAFVEPFFFIGYLISIAIFGLFQAVFMANAGGAWDNAKKVVETELRMKNTPLHEATVVGDTVGDPFKDTSSVAMNPIIKFTTLFGLLAVELAVSLHEQSPMANTLLAVLCFGVSVVFVYRSFYGMRIKND